MKDYSKMSDFEINKAVAINRGGYQGHVKHMEHGVKESDRDSHGIFYFERDYCNNPSDAWEIIDSNLICLMADVFCEPQDGGKWIAQPAYGWQHERVRNDNPLRAAMIMYLMMKDEEK